MAFAKTLKDQEIVIFCDFCFRNITKRAYFRCDECRFDSCAVCAFSNVETSVHSKSHKYRVVSNLETQVDESGWRLIDELLLLDGIISFGFDNFEDISKLLKPKTDIQIKKHLYEMIGIKDNTDNEVSSYTVIKSNPNDSCVASFMSKRQEFDSEILNEYEALIEDLVFEEDDSELEIEYKRFLLENYRNVLKRRKEWRNFILDRKMTDMVKLKAKEKYEVGEALTKKKWIAQYLSKNDFNVFIAGLAIESRLKSQLAKHPGMLDVQDEKLFDNTKLLSKKELELCNTLNVPCPSYVRLKRLSLEMYNIKYPLKKVFFDLFSTDDLQRAKILYKWFVDQKVVIEE